MENLTQTQKEDAAERAKLKAYNTPADISDELKKEITFTAKTIEDVEKQADEIHRVMEEYSVVRITGGLIDPQSIIAAKKKLDEIVPKLGDRASIGEDPKEIQDNFCKLSIGGAQKYGVYRPRCLRTIYNPIWSEDLYGMRQNFIKMAQVRNVLYGFNRDFAIDKIEDSMWTASRFHHYPTGGGFLISHRDTVVPKVHESQGYKGFYQLIMTMSKKGKDADFEQGGGFGMVKGQKYHFEKDTEYGDIVIYDGRTTHGVDDIDPMKPFDQQTMDGRTVGFVTLYKDIDKNYKVPN